MDPLSQAALGAVCAQSTARARLGWISLFGAVGGLAPDLDVLLGSSADPLLFLEYHRQFSHSLVFIPCGGLLVTLALFWLPAQPLGFRQAYLASTVGLATHGLLDACTSYGTQLLWPFTNARISWDLVSVIDPAFTVPLLLLTIVAAGRQSRSCALAGLCWALGYLGIGYGQQQRVMDATLALAAARGHSAERLLVKPAFGNLLLWKSVYRHDGYYYVDGHRAGLQSERCGGERALALNLPRDLPWLAADSQQALDIERFRWFSMNYLSRLDIQQSTLIVDVRYANLPNRVDPLWGITVDSEAPADQHVDWWSNRQLTAEQRAEFGRLLAGNACGA